MEKFRFSNQFYKWINSSKSKLLKLTNLKDTLKELKPKLSKSIPKTHNTNLIEKFK